jgi:hypothetical protein
MKKSSNNLIPASLAILCAFSITSAQAVDSNGLIGYWNADGSAADSSSLHNNGAFAGSYEPGRAGAGQAFDLGTAKVIIPDNSAYNFQAYSGWTVGFWFNTEGAGLGGGNGVFLGQDVSANEFPKWFIDYGYGHPGAFEIHLNNFSSNPRVFLPSNPVSLPDGWNQFTLVRKPDEFDFYLNGTQIGSYGYSFIIPDPAAPLVFGQQEALGYDHLLDDVVIYNRALDSDEVKNLVSPSSVPETGSTLIMLAAATLALLAAERWTQRNRISAPPRVN